MRLANWELLSPLLKSFEQGGAAAATMDLPVPPTVDRFAPAGQELMQHQARFLASVANGHRSFLLADEPGLGKTAQSLLAASVADAYPLLVVVPNVVKMNWAREAELWTPQRRVTVVHGDGDNLDAFADIFVINYEILDRHLSWMSRFGFKGMVVDEAHMIKNVQSQRSRNVLTLAESIRDRVPGADPLMIALTGTPLINDIDDFRAIWRFLGWTEADRPGPKLMAALESNGFTPADSSFYPEARQSVVDLGIVRRRKMDVAKDLPAKRVVDLPVELDDDSAPGIRQAEAQLVARLLDRYNRIMNGKMGEKLSAEQIIRMVCLQELDDSSTDSGLNVFHYGSTDQVEPRPISAADYAAQLARSVGKVVFFAKHIDVMDRAEADFTDAGIGHVSIRGDQNAIARQEQSMRSTTIQTCQSQCVLSRLPVWELTCRHPRTWSWRSSAGPMPSKLKQSTVYTVSVEEPVTAWRIIAAHTIDQRIAELIDAKAGLAARALDEVLRQSLRTRTRFSSKYFMQVLKSALNKR